MPSDDDDVIEKKKKEQERKGNEKEKNVKSGRSCMDRTFEIIDSVNERVNLVVSQV